MRLFFNSPKEVLNDIDRRVFNIDVTRIQWKTYLMNFAYGIKRFILKEEAELPSVGYNDVITVTFRFLKPHSIVNVKQAW
jgi:hypothetical protein